MSLNKKHPDSVASKPNQGTAVSSFGDRIQIVQNSRAISPVVTDKSFSISTPVICQSISLRLGTRIRDTSDSIAFWSIEKCCFLQENNFQKTLPYLAEGSEGPIPSDEGIANVIETSNDRKTALYKIARENLQPPYSRLAPKTNEKPDGVGVQIGSGNPK